MTAIYLGYSAAELHRRNQRSWQTIVSSLVTDSDADAGPWVAYRNAGVMMEMADYLERNARGFDAQDLRELRSHALQLRFYALRSFLHLSGK